MTTLTFHLARALGREWGKGDEIVVTELDHHGNVAPWRALEKERGVTVRMVQMRTRGRHARLGSTSRPAITPRTKLVAIGAASNALGTITDVDARDEARARASARARLRRRRALRAARARRRASASAATSSRCSAYKFYGPHIGVLWGKRDADRIARRAAARAGAAGIARAARDGHAESRRHRRRGGGGGLPRVARRAISVAPARRRCARVRRAARARRRSCSRNSGTRSTRSTASRSTVPKPGTPRTPTLSFTLRGRSTDDVAERARRARRVRLERRLLRGDDRRAARRGADGFVRVGCSCYTTEGEVDRLIEGVRGRSLGAGTLGRLGSIDSRSCAPVMLHRAPVRLAATSSATPASSPAPA